MANAVSRVEYNRSPFLCFNETIVGLPCYLLGFKARVFLAGWTFTLKRSGVASTVYYSYTVYDVFLSFFTYLSYVYSSVLSQQQGQAMVAPVSCCLIRERRLSVG